MCSTCYQFNMWHQDGGMFCRGVEGEEVVKEDDSGIDLIESDYEDNTDDDDEDDDDDKEDDDADNDENDNDNVGKEEKNETLYRRKERALKRATLLTKLCKHIEEVSSMKTL